MAEPLSVVASAVGVAAFAQQLVQCVLKIKAFCANVRSAPAELQETLDQIENVSNIMAKLGREDDTMLNSSMNEDILVESLQLCQKAVERISTLAFELQDDMKQRKMRTSVKTVLKQDTMYRMLAKLDRSKADLQFAYSMYADARRTKQLEHLRRCMCNIQNGQAQMIEYTRPVSLCRIKSDDLQIIEQLRLYRPRRKRPATRRSIYIQLPRWLCQYAWDVAFEKACGCWTVCLKSFQIIENYGSVWDMCYYGDVEGIRGLLDKRQLSIHDRDEEGRSLALLAAGNGQTMLAKFLVQSGAEAVWEPKYIAYATGHATEGPFSMTLGSSLEQIKYHARFLLESNEILPGCNLSVSDRSSFEDGVVSDLQTFSKEPSCLTHEDRLTILLCFGHPGRLTLFRDLCGSRSIEPGLFSAKGPRNSTFLQFLARQWARTQGPSNRWRKVLGLTLSRAIGQAVGAGADLHVPNVNGFTPFMQFLTYNQCGGSHEVIRSWVEILEQGGVDLEEYGYLECETLRKVRAEMRWSRWIRGDIVGFAYGPKPSDWRLWHRQSGDGFAGQFWHIIENYELNIPGAWIYEAEYAEDQEEWTPETKSRWSGVKRKCLRQMQYQSKRNSHYTWQDACDYVNLLAALRNEVDRVAEFRKTVPTTSNEADDLWESEQRVRGLARQLGVIRADWNDDDWF